MAQVLIKINNALIINNIIIGKAKQYGNTETGTSLEWSLQNSKYQNHRLTRDLKSGQALAFIIQGDDRYSHVFVKQNIDVVYTNNRHRMLGKCN